MSSKVLVLSANETFSVRGLEMKLKGIGVETVFSNLSIKSLKKSSEELDLIILYCDEDINEETEGLVFLKDYCMENDLRIIVIGSAIEYEVVQKYVPPMAIHSFFERPLKMDKLLDEVEQYLSDESEHSKRKSILIVDDDVAYMSMIMDWLKDRYHVAMANSGMQAITYLAKNNADLILLDYEMPITSGPQVLEMIRSEASTANIPVMFLTGKNDKESIMNVLSLKPVDYLLKTIDRANLREKIEHFFMIQLAEESNQ